MTQVREVMTSNPAKCSPQDTVVDAARLMAQQDVGPIPVVDGDRLVGLLTDRDIVVRVVAEGRSPEQALELVEDLIRERVRDAVARRQPVPIDRTSVKFLWLNVEELLV